MKLANPWGASPEWGTTRCSKYTDDRGSTDGGRRARPNGRADGRGDGSGLCTWLRDPAPGTSISPVRPDEQPGWHVIKRLRWGAFPEARPSRPAAQCRSSSAPTVSSSQASEATTCAFTPKSSTPRGRSPQSRSSGDQGVPAPPGRARSMSARQRIARGRSWSCPARSVSKYSKRAKSCSAASWAMMTPASSGVRRGRS